MFGDSIPGGDFEFFSLPRPDRLCGPSGLHFNVYRDPSPGIKRLGRETDRSPPPSAEIKNAWRYISSPNTPS